MIHTKKQIDQKILDEIMEMILKMKFGEVVITVHDSKVVQIEERRKKRFSLATAPAEQD